MLSLDFLPSASLPLHTDSLLEPAYLGMTRQQTTPQGMTSFLYAHPTSHEVDRVGKRPSYLSSTALSADNDRLVDWFNQALDIPVGLFTHSEDVGLQFLKHHGVKGHMRECLSPRSG